MNSKLINFSQLWELLPLEVTFGAEVGEQDYWANNPVSFSYSSIAKRLSIAYERLGYEILQHLKIDCGNKDWLVAVSIEDLMALREFVDTWGWSRNDTIIFIDYDKSSCMMKITKVRGDTFSIVDTGDGELRPVELGYVNDADIVSIFSFKPNEAGLAIVHNASKSIVGDAKKVWIYFHGRSHTLRLENFSKHQWTRASMKASDGATVSFCVDWEMLWDLFSYNPEEVSVVVTPTAVNFESEEVSVFGTISHFNSSPEILQEIWEGLPKCDPIALDYGTFVKALDELTKEYPLVSFQNQDDNLVLSSLKPKQQKIIVPLWGHFDPDKVTHPTQIVGTELLGAIENLPPDMGECTLRITETGVLLVGHKLPFQTWILGLHNEGDENSLIETVPTLLGRKSRHVPTLDVTQQSNSQLYRELLDQLQDLIKVSGELDSPKIRALDSQWWELFGSPQAMTVQEAIAVLQDDQYSVFPGFYSFPENLENDPTYVDCLLYFKEQFEAEIIKAVKEEEPTLPSLQIYRHRKVVMRYQFRIIKNLRQSFEDICLNNLP